MISFRRRYVHLNRYRQVVNVLARQGFGYALDQLGLGELLSRWYPKTPPLSAGARLRRALQELGPTFIKLGQFLSTRADLLPEEVVAELAQLQDRVAPFEFYHAEGIITQELGLPPQELFTSFDQEPLASASIGQVYRATLPGGTAVIVKIQRPGIRQVIETDIEILFDLARLAQRHTSWGQIYDFVEMAEEFAQALTAELDYAREGRNADRFRRNFAGDPDVYIPAVFWDYTTSRVLTMEYIDSVKLNDIEALQRSGYNLKRIAARLVKVFYKQVLIDGFFHADPHPGNIGILPGERLVLMDFGLVGNLSCERREQFIKLVVGLIRRRSRDIVEAIADMGILPPGIDLKSLRYEVDRLRDKYLDVPVSQLSVGAAVNDLLNLSFRYHVRLPTEFTLLAKALLTLEGLAARLDPEINLVEIAEPYGRQLIRQRLSPPQLLSRLEESLHLYRDILLRVPAQAQTILERVAKEGFVFKLQHGDLKLALAHLERMANKLSFGLALLSFSIIMSGLIISAALGVVPAARLFFRLPILETGFIVAGLMSLWLLWAIFRSGRL
ncbi:MAG: ubiquinone biosynthesis protein [Clostridia bacterium]|nr:ubiquinone biosynthesis protein [Clostridia bacterium]